MAKEAAVPLFLLLIVSFTLGGAVASANPNQQKTWCVARPSSDKATLLANVNYACSQVDCRVIQMGPCFNPDNLMNHASVAMNLYYQAKGRNQGACDFRGSGIIAITDPSYADCIYA